MARRSWLQREDDDEVIDGRVRTVFTDRKKDMAAMDGQLNVHSLKW
jgi:hypothetical protein